MMPCPICGKGELDTMIKSIRFKDTGYWIVTWQCPNNRHQQLFQTEDVIKALSFEGSPK